MDNLFEGNGYNLFA